jgi:hypothetical protein
VATIVFPGLSAAQEKAGVATVLDAMARVGMVQDEEAVPILVIPC